MNLATSGLHGLHSCLFQFQNILYYFFLPCNDHSETGFSASTIFLSQGIIRTSGRWPATVVLLSNVCCGEDCNIAVHLSYV